MGDHKVFSISNDTKRNLQWPSKRKIISQFEIYEAIRPSITWMKLTGIWQMNCRYPLEERTWFFFFYSIALALVCGLVIGLSAIVTGCNLSLSTLFGLIYASLNAFSIFVMNRLFRRSEDLYRFMGLWESGFSQPVERSKSLRAIRRIQWIFLAVIVATSIGSAGAVAVHFVSDEISREHQHSLPFHLPGWLLQVLIVLWFLLYSAYITSVSFFALLCLAVKHKIKWLITSLVDVPNSLDSLKSEYSTASSLSNEQMPLETTCCDRKLIWSLYITVEKEFSLIEEMILLIENLFHPLVTVVLGMSTVILSLAVYEALRICSTEHIVIFYQVSSPCIMIGPSLYILGAAAAVNTMSVELKATLDRKHFACLSLHERFQVSDFKKRLCCVGVTASGFTVVTKQTILTIIGLWITYVAVLIQMMPRHLPCSATGVFAVGNSSHIL